MTQNEQSGQSREEMIKAFLDEERTQDDGSVAQRPQEAQDNGSDTPLALPSADDRGDGNDGFDIPEDDSALIAWEGPEFEVYERDKQWYIAVLVVLLLIIIYAVIINSPIMAITFILIGVVGYIYLQKDPRHLVFAVTAEGVVVGEELFPFGDIESFWIFYEPPHTYLLSLRMRNRALPYVHMPLHQVDPVELREALLQFIPEERQEMGVIDTIERLMHF